MAGRPKTLSFEQREENRKLANKNYRKNHREKYNTVVNKYHAANREKVRAQQNERYRIRTAEKKSPFYVQPPCIQVPESTKESLSRMAELIQIGCVEKKTKGSNYLEVTGKSAYRKIMKQIGFSEEADLWISRSWMDIPMKILGWKDIRKNKIDFKKMIVYGHLLWFQKLPKDSVKSIVGYM
jgi:hypothetical protein